MTATTAPGPSTARTGPTGAPARAGRRTVAAVVVCGLAVALLALVGLDSRATYGAATSADEPYYLLTAQSLVDDGDLDISDELAEGAFRPYHEVALDEQTRPLDEAGRRVSPHDPLLSVLLAPAMALPADVGWVAAKGTLVVLAGVLASLTTWLAVRRLDVRPWRAAAVVVGLGGALPLAGYGTQVYPELPAALALLVGVAAASSPRWAAPSRLATLVLAVVALPWLAVKYVPVTAALVVVAGVRAWRDGRRRELLVVAGVLAAAGVAYLVAHRVWYGGWTVYAVGDHFAETGELSVVGTQPDLVGRSRRLVGLLVDRDYGLAAWSPAWLLAPAAVAVALRDRVPGRALLLAPLAAGWATATWVALTMHGWWVPGRQVVVVLPLLVLLVARWVDGWRSPVALGAAAAALLGGVVNWVVAAREAATGGPVLIVDLAESAAPVRRALAPLLPDGRDATPADDVLLLVWAVAIAATVVLAVRHGRRGRTPRRDRRVLALGLLATGATVVAAGGLVAAVDGAVLVAARDQLLASPGGVLAGLAAFGAAFLLRAEAWHRVLPELSRGHALAGIHLALGGNHVLPLRLGEPLRVVSAVRRAGVDPASATASTLALRSADVVSLLLLGVVAGPGVVAGLLGPLGGAVAAVVAVVGAAAVWWLGRRRGLVGAVPGVAVVGLTTAAWLLEAVLVLQVARVFDVALSPAEAVLVLAVAVAGQLLAVTPGGVGTYEAAATAGLVATGVEAGTALALALGLHATKTVWSVLVGLVALVAPAPGLLGSLRLPRDLPARPAPLEVAGDAPVVLFLPAYEEGPRVADVVARAPARVHGREVVVAVVDDGSTDDTAARAAAAGAVVVPHDRNRGLGAAVRTGLAWADARGAAAVAFCDADGEYDPAQLADLVGPVLSGEADYVGGSRFAGDIEWMRPHRRLGNKVLTSWVRWTVRRPVTDGQTGYRAFSPAAARSAHVPHDYNYAQVLTIDLVARGFVYAEVPIAYRFRESGRSFVRLGRYLRRVVPTVWRQLNPRLVGDLPAGHHARTPIAEHHA